MNTFRTRRSADHRASLATCPTKVGEVACHHKRRRRGDKTRRGAAAVELAIVLPVVFMLVFGTLEVCQRMLLRQSATVAAYESARLAARRTVTAVRAEARGNALLVNRRITNGSVQIFPGDLSEVQTGEDIRIVVRVPIAGNTVVNYVLPSTGEITVEATMLRE